MINRSKIKNMSNQNNPQNPGPCHLCKTTTTPGQTLKQGLIVTVIALAAIVAMSAAITYVEALWQQ
jgi:hypothetical protein